MILALLMLLGFVATPLPPVASPVEAPVAVYHVPTAVEACFWPDQKFPVGRVIPIPAGCTQRIEAGLEIGVN
jgi:hypothetical protein